QLNMICNGLWLAEQLPVKALQLSPIWRCNILQKYFAFFSKKCLQKTAVISLKEELRVPVILYYIEDFNIKEIAQILEITEGAVQKRLARARGKLKSNLQESEALIV
ncbi:RNA polymerase sigma factor, partial [bacterium]|nr:RNA polymerase sigma factor [bacterium]MDY3023555.1 RNA polymerase sigma factor [Oliverpabstia sp.]